MPSLNTNNAHSRGKVATFHHCVPKDLEIKHGHVPYVKIVIDTFIVNVVAFLVGLPSMFAWYTYSTIQQTYERDKLYYINDTFYVVFGNFVFYQYIIVCLCWGNNVQTKLQEKYKKPTANNFADCFTIGTKLSMNSTLLMTLFSIIVHILINGIIFYYLWEMYNKLSDISFEFECDWFNCDSFNIAFLYVSIIGFNFFPILQCAIIVFILCMYKIRINNNKNSSKNYVNNAYIIKESGLIDHDHEVQSELEMETNDVVNPHQTNNDKDMINQNQHVADSYSSISNSFIQSVKYNKYDYPNVHHDSNDYHDLTTASVLQIRISIMCHLMLFLTIWAIFGIVMLFVGNFKVSKLGGRWDYWYYSMFFTTSLTKKLLKRVARLLDKLRIQLKFAQFKQLQTNSDALLGFTKNNLNAEHNREQYLFSIEWVCKHIESSMLLAKKTN